MGGKKREKKYRGVSNCLFYIIGMKRKAEEKKRRRKRGLAICHLQPPSDGWKREGKSQKGATSRLDSGKKKKRRGKSSYNSCLLLHLWKYLVDWRRKRKERITLLMVVSNDE